MRGEIKFTDIVKIIEASLAAHKTRKINSLDDVFALDEEIRASLDNHIKKLEVILKKGKFIYDFNPFFVFVYLSTWLGFGFISIYNSTDYNWPLYKK